MLILDSKEQTQRSWPGKHLLLPCGEKRSVGYEAAACQDVHVEGRAGSGCYSPPLLTHLWSAQTADPWVVPPTVLPVSGMLSKPPEHTLRCSCPSFGPSGSLLFLWEICISLLSPSVLSSAFSSSLLYGHHCLRTLYDSWRLKPGRLIHFCSPRHSSCHGAEHSECLLNEAVNLSPFYPPHNILLWKHPANVKTE